MTTTYALAPNGVFWTLQGEGALLGTPMVFVRLAGCSVGCPQCDTDYRVSRRVEVDALVAEVQQVTPTGFQWPWAWITGGEPTDHDLAPLIAALRTAGYRVALATSGTRPVAPVSVDWLSVSPHSLDFVQRLGQELKIVPGLNSLTLDALANMEAGSFAWRFLQPLSGDATSLRECTAFVLTHPGWQMTIQAHKQWGLA